MCHQCEEERDTAQHTLAECSAWSDERRVLTNTVGEDLSLPVLVAKMTSSEEDWKAVASFCEAVMLQKEAAERIRRQEAAALPPPPPVNAREGEEGLEEETTSWPSSSPPSSPFKENEGDKSGRRASSPNTGR